MRFLLIIFSILKMHFCVVKIDHKVVVTDIRKWYLMDIFSVFRMNFCR